MYQQVFQGSKKDFSHSRDWFLCGHSPFDNHLFSERPIAAFGLSQNQRLADLSPTGFSERGTWITSGLPAIRPETAIGVFWRRAEANCSPWRSPGGRNGDRRPEHEFFTTAKSLTHEFIRP
jgi:hypothetical protein